MPTIDISYGRRKIEFPFDERKFDLLRPAPEPAALTDVEIGERFDNPIGSQPIEEIIAPGETVLFVVPDTTRSSASGQMINLLVRRLIANGTMPHEMAAIFATGIHRPVTAAERQEILTPFIAQRLKTIDHAPRDLMRIGPFGETSSGIPVGLNRALTEFDHAVAIGSVNFHYFAGFSGGRKLFCPGLASAKTIAETHKLAFDFENLTRTKGVGPGILDGNAVHEAFVEAAGKVKVSFAVNSIVDESGAAYEMFCGDLLRSHRAACDAFAATNTLRIRETRSVVIAGCGGHPHDLNLIQAHKALDAAASACSEGGTIILAAECPDGTEQNDFLNWFDAPHSAALAERLRERYRVNGQTAWSLLKKAERFTIRLATSLEIDGLKRMRIDKISLAEFEKAGDLSAAGFIIPAANKVRIIVDQSA